MTGNDADKIRNLNDRVAKLREGIGENRRITNQPMIADLGNPPDFTVLLDELHGKSHDFEIIEAIVQKRGLGPTIDLLAEFARRSAMRAAGRDDRSGALRWRLRLSHLLHCAAMVEKAR